MALQTILWIILAAILALGISLFQYYFKSRKRSKKWPWFAFFRFISLFCLFLLLINPKIKQKKFYIEKPSLVLAVDNSKSIGNFGQAEEVKNFVSDLQNNKKLTEHFDLEIYTFGQKFRTVDSLSFSENQTKIGEALRRLQQIYKNQTAPMVLLSDGNQTFGQTYVYTAQQYDSEIYPVVVGDTTQYVDLKIGQLNANRYVFLNNKFPVEVFVHYNGTENSSQEFVIKQGKTVIFRKKLNFSNENTLEIVRAQLPANSTGVKTYSVLIKPINNEKNKVNNRRNFAIEVMDEKTEVLLLAGILHPDIGALKKAIESNPQRHVSLKKIGEHIDFGNYQLVVLYQPDRRFQSVYEKMDDLKLNTFTITGTATDYQFLNSVQSDFQKKSSNQTEDYLPVFNDNYTIFQPENIGYGDFPPLKDKFGTIDFKNSLHPILFQSIGGFPTNVPLLGTFENEEGQRKAYLFGEGLWKWRAKVYLDTHSFQDFDAFIGKLVQYLASIKKRSRLELTYDSFYNKGEPVVLEAAYFDRNYVFDPGAQLIFFAKDKETGKTIERPFLLKNNSYKISLGDIPPGEYSFKVRVENQNLSKSGEFTLVDFQVEKQFMSANLKKLRQIATHKNQAVYFLNNPTDLVEDLLQNKAFQPVQKSNEKNLPLIDWYYLLAIIVVALSLEWFIRKYHGLL